MTVRHLLAMLAMTLMAAGAAAQTAQVGLRLEGGTALGAGMLWRFDVETVRAEVGVGWSKSGQHVDQTAYAAHLWHGQLRDGWEWEAGPALHLAWQTWSTRSGGSSVAVALGAQVGISYRFENLPIALGLDLRPRLTLLGREADSWGVVALSIRYRW